MPIKRALKTAPNELPVCLDEQKQHSVVLIDEDDSLIEQYIKAATDVAEMFMRRRFVSRVWTAYIDNNFVDRLSLPEPPLVSVDEVRYLDTDSVQQILDPAVYVVDARQEPGIFARADGQTWPEVKDVVNTIEIDFTSGYGTASEVPAHIKSAVMIIAAHLYENRELAAIGVSTSEIPYSAHALLSHDRVWTL